MATQFDYFKTQPIDPSGVLQAGVNSADNNARMMLSAGQNLSNILREQGAEKRAAERDVQTFDREATLRLLLQHNEIAAKFGDDQRRGELMASLVGDMEPQQAPAQQSVYGPPAGQSAGGGGGGGAGSLANFAPPRAPDPERLRQLPPEDQSRVLGEYNRRVNDWQQQTAAVQKQQAQLAEHETASHLLDNLKREGHLDPNEEANFVGLLNRGDTKAALDGMFKKSEEVKDEAYLSTTIKETTKPLKEQFKTDPEMMGRVAALEAEARLSPGTAADRAKFFSSGVNDLLKEQSQSKEKLAEEQRKKDPLKLADDPAFTQPAKYGGLVENAPEATRAKVEAYAAKTAAELHKDSIMNAAMSVAAGGAASGALLQNAAALMEKDRQAIIDQTWTAGGWRHAPATDDGGPGKMVPPGEQPGQPIAPAPVPVAPKAGDLKAGEILPKEVFGKAAMAVDDGRAAVRKIIADHLDELEAKKSSNEQLDKHWDEEHPEPKPPSWGLNLGGKQIFALGQDAGWVPGETQKAFDARHKAWEEARKNRAKAKPK